MITGLSHNTFLTGFMGSGKTTFGQKLAKLLREKFIDLDQYVERREKLSVSELFENFGETAFRQIEKSCLEEILEKEKRAVISLGGGTICNKDNLAKVKRSGFLIYIEMPAADLAKRLENSKVKRPLLKNLKGQELANFISDKLKEREVFYNSAHAIVSGINLTPQILYQLVGEHRK